MEVMKTRFQPTWSNLPHSLLYIRQTQLRDWAGRPLCTSGPRYGKRRGNGHLAEGERVPLKAAGPAGSLLASTQRLCGGVHSTPFPPTSPGCGLLRSLVGSAVPAPPAPRVAH